MALHKFTRNELGSILRKVVNKTLVEVDIKNVFTRTIIHPKITGIAEDVAEQSILGYPADSDKKTDLLVDRIHIELKTIDICTPKKQGDFIYEAKEPIPITPVSYENITNEDFDISIF